MHPWTHPGTVNSLQGACECVSVTVLYILVLKYMIHSFIKVQLYLYFIGVDTITFSCCCTQCLCVCLCNISSHEQSGMPKVSTGLGRVRVRSLGWERGWGCVGIGKERAKRKGRWRRCRRRSWWSGTGGQSRDKKMMKAELTRACFLYSDAPFGQNTAPVCAFRLPSPLFPTPLLVVYKYYLSKKLLSALPFPIICWQIVQPVCVCVSVWVFKYVPGVALLRHPHVQVIHACWLTSRCLHCFVSQ